MTHAQVYLGEQWDACKHIICILMLRPLQLLYARYFGKQLMAARTMDLRHWSSPQLPALINLSTLTESVSNLLVILKQNELEFSVQIYRARCGANLGQSLSFVSDGSKWPPKAAASACGSGG